MLDAGALIGVERGDRTALLFVAEVTDDRGRLIVPAGVLGQVWRDGRKQARLARFLSTGEVTIEPLDEFRARAAGQLCGVRRTRDVIDASVVLCAREHDFAVLTSDPDDLARLDPTVRLVVI